MNFTSQDRHTRTPYWITQNLPRLSGVQVKILIFISHKNSFDDATKEFSVRYLSVRTGEKKSTIHENLNKLISSGILYVIGYGKRGVKKLDIPSDCPASLLADCPELGVQMQPNASVLNKKRPVMPDSHVQKRTVEVPDCPVGRTLLSGDDGQIRPVDRTSINTPNTNTSNISTPSWILDLKTKIAPGSAEQIRSAFRGYSNGRPVFDNDISPHLIKIAERFAV